MGGKSNSGESLDIFEIFELLWKKKWVILLPALSAALIVLLYFKIIPQNKFLVLNVDSMDILLLKNKEGKQHFSIRDFNELAKIEGYDLEIETKTGSKNTLLERQFVDSIIVKKKIGSGDIPDGFVLDFFLQIEKKYFEMFKTKLKIRLMSNQEIIFRKGLNLKDLEIKIKTIEKYSMNSSKIFISNNIGDPVFLPPLQLMNGYKIKSDFLRYEINNLTEQDLLINELLIKIEKDRIETFRKLFKIKGIVNYKRLYSKQEFIPEKADLLISKYKNEIHLKNSADNYLKFTILVFMLIFALQIFIVLFSGIIRLNKEMKSK